MGLLGVGLLRPHSCKPLRSVAVVDEDSFFDMVHVHVLQTVGDLRVPAPPNHQGTRQLLSKEKLTIPDTAPAQTDELTPRRSGFPIISRCPESPTPASVS